MTRRLLSPTPWLVAALALFLTVAAGTAAADRIETVSGRVVEGTIVFEDENNIRIRTDRYGELGFRKLDLRSVQRSSGSGSSAPAGSSPPAGGTSSGSTNPFGGSGSSGPSSNPFGGGSASGGSTNPFGGASSPSAPGSSPFGAPAGGSAFSQAEQQPAAQAPAPIEIPAIIPRTRLDMPDIPFGFDAVLFDFPDEATARVKRDPISQFQVVDKDTTIRRGGEVVTIAHHLRLGLGETGDVLRVPPNTELVLAEAGDGNVTIDLKRGVVWSEVADRQGGEGSFTIRTPNVTAGVMGTVFRVSASFDQGVNVAVLEGRVRVDSSRAQISNVVGAREMVTVNPDGTMSPIMPLSEAIAREYLRWEEWAAEAQSALGGMGMGVGGAAAAALIEQTARDNAAWGAAMAEGNYFIGINRLGQFINEVGKAFERYASDTGHVPTDEEAFSILRQNIGDRPGWDGPYWEGQLPPRDSWGRPLRYRTRVSTRSGNIVGVVYSVGEDGVDHGGSPANDITELVLYYQLESIRENPLYDPQRLLDEMGGAP